MWDSAGPLAVEAVKSWPGCCCASRCGALRYRMNWLTAAASDAVGEPLVVDSERVLGPDQSGTLIPRDNLASARRR